MSRIRLEEHDRTLERDRVAQWNVEGSRAIGPSRGRFAPAKETPEATLALRTARVIAAPEVVALVASIVAATLILTLL